MLFGWFHLYSSGVIRLGDPGEIYLAIAVAAGAHSTYSDAESVRRHVWEVSRVSVWVWVGCLEMVVPYVSFVSFKFVSRAYRYVSEGDVLDEKILQSLLEFLGY